MQGARAGVAFADERGNREVVEQEHTKTSRRKSRMVKEDQPEGGEAANTRRNSGGASGAKARGEKHREEGGSSRDRRKSVKGAAGTGQHSTHTSGGNSPRKHAPKHQHKHDRDPNFGQVMDQSAKKITAAVNSLYRTIPKDDDGAALRDPKESAQGKKGIGDSPGNSTSGAGRRRSLLYDDEGPSKGSPDSSSDSESSESDEEKGHKHKNASDDLEDTGSSDYDFKQSALKVDELLNSLHSDTRTNIMSDLNTWYASRRAGVDDDIVDLGSLDAEHHHREEETKTSMACMLQSFEEKQMREVKVLVKCNRTLNLGARQKLKRRKRHARRDAPRHTELHETMKELDKIAPIEKTKRVGPRRTQRPPKTLKSQENQKKVVYEDVEGEPKKNSPDKQKKSKASTAAKSKATTGGAAKKQEDSDNSDSTDSDEKDDAHDSSNEMHEDDSAEDQSATSDDDNLCESPGEQEMPQTLDDGLDLEAARRKLKEMQEVQVRVTGVMNAEEPVAGEILGSLASVQQSQMQLEVRADLAKKACDLAKAALDHLVEGAQIDEADEAVRYLIEMQKVQLFGKDGDTDITGPDPEELEEECRALELLIAKQEKDIDAYNKYRDRSNRLETEKEETIVKENESDDGDDTQAQPKLQKSELRDGRLEAAQTMRSNISARIKADTPPPKAKPALTRLRTTVKLVRTKTKEMLTEENKAPAGDAAGGETVLPSPAAEGAGIAELPPSWQSSRVVQLLHEKISEKEAKVATAKLVYRRMKKEYALLQYCAHKSECGLDAMVEGFDLSNIGGDSETSASSASDTEKDKNASDSSSVNAAKERKSVVKVVSDKVGEFARANASLVREEIESDSASSKSRESKRLSRRSTAGKRGTAVTGRKSETRKSQSTQEVAPKDSPARQRNMRNDEQFSQEVVAFNNKKIEEAETEMKGKISEIQVLIARDTHAVKSEKKRQNLLKKDINRLKKSYERMTKKVKDAPTSLETLDGQMSLMLESESKLKVQMRELTEEFNRQQRMLERAQEEAKEREEDKRRNAAFAASDPRATVANPSAPLDGSETAVTQAASFMQATETDFSITDDAGASALAAVHSIGGDGTAAGPEVGEESQLSLSSSKSQNSATPASAPSASAAGVAASSSTSALSMSASTPQASGAGTAQVQEPGAASSGAAAQVQGAQQATTQSNVSPASARRVSKLGSTSAVGSKADKEPDGKTEGQEGKTAQGVGQNQSVGHDLAELVKVQSTNEDLKQRIEEAMKKMQQLRSMAKKGKGVSSDAIEEIVGKVAVKEEAKPPAEYYSLKKDMRGKQEEVRQLRKRWWTDHKDLDSIVERVRLQHGTSENHTHRRASTDLFAPRRSSIEGLGNHDKGHHDQKGHHDHGHSGIHEQKVDLDAIRRKFAEAQQQQHMRRSSTNLHSMQDVPSIVGHAPVQQKENTSRLQVQPRALGSLAAYQSVEASGGSRYRLSSELAHTLDHHHHHEPLSPPVCVTGKTFKRLSSTEKEKDGTKEKPKEDEEEVLTPIQKRYSQVRRSLVPEAVHSLTELVQGEDSK